MAPAMIKWVKPSGLKIETNDMDETVEYCKSLGWKKANGRKPKEDKTPEELKKIEEEKAKAAASGAVTTDSNR